MPIEIMAVRVAQLEAVIKEHNDGLEQTCAWRRGKKGWGELCQAYTSRGKCCTDCPREYVIEIPT